MKILRDFSLHKERLSFLKEAFRKVRFMPRKQLLVVMGAVVLVILLGVYGLSLTLGKQRDLVEMESKLDTAEGNIIQAETKGAFDKETATELLTQAESLTIEVLNSGYLGARASQMLDKIEEQRDYIDNVFHVDDELKLVVGLSTRLGTSTILGVEPYGDRLVVYTDNAAFQILIDQVEEPDVLDAVERTTSAHYFSDYETLAMLTESGKLIEYTEGNPQFADTADGEWHSGTTVVTYTSKLYILDPVSKQIWKYTRGTSGYGSAQAYLTNETVDLSDAVSMAIDGSVWVLHDDGTLDRLLSGEPVLYSIKKAPITTLETATQVYTELELNQVYILDPVEKRILVYDKSSKNNDLTYSSQFVLDELEGTLLDMYFDKDRDVMVLVTERALYELSF